MSEQSEMATDDIVAISSVMTPEAESSVPSAPSEHMGSRDGSLPPPPATGRGRRRESIMLMKSHEQAESLASAANTCDETINKLEALVASLNMSNALTPLTPRQMAPRPPKETAGEIPISAEVSGPHGHASDPAATSPSIIHQARSRPQGRVIPQHTGCSIGL